MKYTVASNKIEAAFNRAHHSLWSDSNRKVIQINEQILLWKQRFGVRLYGGYFEKVHSIYCPMLEFESEEAFVLFMLEWS